MAEAPIDEPPGVDASIPNVARMYDYYLGGENHFPVDREAAERAVALSPHVRFAAQANRGFLRRTVRHLTEAGVHQFLDIGSGMPTQGSVHEVAQQVHPASRVVYVDNDAYVCSHSTALLGDTLGVAIAQGDIRDPEAILAHDTVRNTLDWSQPVAVLILAVLHFVTDDEKPHEAVATLRDAMAPGSHLILSHTTAAMNSPKWQDGQELYERTGSGLHLRSHAGILPFFDGFDLLEPGLVWTPLWRPAPGDEAVPAPETALVFGGVGRKA
jgi:hypothetical protein